MVHLISDLYSGSATIDTLTKLCNSNTKHIKINGNIGSFLPIAIANIAAKFPEQHHCVILPDYESAAYFTNDLENIFEEQQENYPSKQILLYPSSHKKPYQTNTTCHANILLRTEVLEKLASNPPTVLVSFPEALTEKMIRAKELNKHSFTLTVGDCVVQDDILDLLEKYNFQRVDFVISPGEYALRGGILDVFSFDYEQPYRIEFFGDNIESLRTFDPVSQLSIKTLETVKILPDLETNPIAQTRYESILSYFSSFQTHLWINGIDFSTNKIKQLYQTAETAFQELPSPSVKHIPPQEIYLSKEEFSSQIENFQVFEFGNQTPYFEDSETIDLHLAPQPSFNKNFHFLVQNLNHYSEQHYQNFFCVNNDKQKQRIEKVLQEFSSENTPVLINYLPLALASGFIDHDNKILLYTDHELFERYHKYKVQDHRQDHESLTIKELFELKPGDYVTHIDYGVGRFGGLEKIETNGHRQETLRLVYKDNDILYVSIHALHKISRYVGKDGSEPTLHRLGSSTWENLKRKTKQQVKDIAKDLIKLYAERKAAKGFAFSADSYLQDELEASFIYEDTPDQHKATRDVKHDMEAQSPMDRLICGDVGFGKTEIAIRAAFKAVADSKQVAVLVPTTVLSMQHFRTFSERLKNMPCKVAHINRFCSTKEKNQIKKDIKSGNIDILIGTHRLIGKDLEFKDLGLLIIDEEQKFGVSVKERLKQMKVNIDTLTLSATPIPRTLQFSLMGARDLSIINTPPPNRYPVKTEIHTFDKELIRDCILFELQRGGQVYFVHNRVQDIMEIAGLIQGLLPDAHIAVAHGKMDGKKLEDIMLSFIEGEYDILVSTSIVENGLDIPNANTIIINNAQNFGLADLHQLRGRVGRSNKKSFCYLLTPPLVGLSEEAQKRLKAINDFSNIGSGFNIAMRDLDIRGAGNILGAEQSGFISEIGFDMYHKILNEAIQELKTNEFKDLYTEVKGDDSANIPFVNECRIETDLELLIPNEYVSNVTERLSLYKELDSLETDEELTAFNNRLKDRFGTIPPQTMELIEIVRLRRMAKDLGFEKLILKQGKMVAHFVSNKNSDYYQSELFGKILQYLQGYQRNCRIKQSSEKLTLIFSPLKTLSDAIKLFSELMEATQ